MNLLFLTLRGNVIGDSVREISLAKKYINDYSSKFNIPKNKIKIYYPCGSLLYNLFKGNKYIIPIKIKEFDLLNNLNISKIKKLYFLIIGSFKIIQLLNNKSFYEVVYLGNLYKIRTLIARLISIKFKSKFKQDSFESAIGINAELNFTKKEEIEIKKYLKGNKNKRIVICTEASSLEKRFKLIYFEKIIQYFLDNNYYIFLVGVEKHYNISLIKKFENNKNFNNLINKISIKLVALLIKKSKLYIENDSGIAHIGSAINTDLLIININQPTERENIFNFNNDVNIKVLKNPNLKEVFKEIKNAE